MAEAIQRSDDGGRRTHIPPATSQPVVRLDDNSDGIDAGAGTVACACLTDEQMDQAIEDIHDDLVAGQDATATP